MASDYPPSLLIAGAGVVLNLANFLYTKRKVRDEVVRQRTFLLADELFERTREAADEIQRHISWESGRKTAAEIYRLEKKCRLTLRSLVALVGERSVPIEAAFASWSSVLLGEGFPVSKKENRFLPATARYTSVATAQETFEAVLNKLVVEGCRDTRRRL